MEPPKHLQTLQKEQQFNTFHPTLSVLKNISLKMYLDQIEKSLVKQALRKSDWNQIKAAEILGEPRHIIRYFVKKHDLVDK